MKTLGIKLSAIRNDNGWKGYYRIPTDCPGHYIEKTMKITRQNEYDAHKDALLAAKRYSEQNDVAFIVEGYRL